MLKLALGTRPVSGRHGLDFNCHSLYGAGHMQADNSRSASLAVAVSRHSRSESGISKNIKNDFVDGWRGIDR